MKFLVLFAVAVLSGSVHCDQECFRGVFKECAKKFDDSEHPSLCDHVQYETACIARFAKTCDMPFRIAADELNTAILRVCRDGPVKNWFREERPCFRRAINDSECTGPLEENRNVFEQGDIIRANKKMCGRIQPYSKCVKRVVAENCGLSNSLLFSWMYDPLNDLLNSLCEHLILPADEHDTRPDNFGQFNVLQSVRGIFFNN